MKEKSPIINFNKTDSQGKIFKGTFHVRKISIFGFAAIETEKVKLAKGLGYNGLMHELMIEKMAVIDNMVVRVDDGAEKWFFMGEPEKTWSADDMFDMDILNQLYEEVKSYDALFRKPGNNQADDGGSEKESSSSNQDDSNLSDSVVRKNIPSVKKKHGNGEVEFN